MNKQAAGRALEPYLARKICIVSHDTPSVIPFRGHLLKSLVAKGHDVEVLAPNATEGDIDAIEKLDVRCKSYSLDRTGLSPWSDLGMAYSLYRHFKKSQPDVAIFYAVKPCVFGPVAARTAGVPKRIASTEGLGLAFTESKRQKSILRSSLRLVVSTLYKASMHNATHALFLNTDDQNDFVRWRIISSDKTRVVGAIGVDLSDYTYTPPSTPAPVFLFVARLLREKGICEFVDAARIVRARYSQARFVVLGAIDESPAGITHDMLKKWTETGAIEHYGHVNVRPWLAKASVFVLPSYYREGVPRSTQEAMAVGRAVVTTDVPGCRDTVISGVNGFLCEPRNADELARHLCCFIESPNLIPQMGAASRRMAEERFDVRKCTERIIQAYGLEDT